MLIFLKESTDTEYSLCVLRFSRQIKYRDWGKVYISGRKFCGKDEASKCMPETDVEVQEFRRRLTNIHDWETCSDFCKEDELCYFFNYWVN